MNRSNDPDPEKEKKKITNADEQDVVVNQSTKEEGYDEPAPAKKQPDPPQEVKPREDTGTYE